MGPTTSTLVDGQIAEALQQNAFADHAGRARDDDLDAHAPDLAERGCAHRHRRAIRSRYRRGVRALTCLTGIWHGDARRAARQGRADHELRIAGEQPEWFEPRRPLARLLVNHTVWPPKGTARTQFSNT